MKANDAVWGALLLLFSVAVVVHVQAFPKIPGQQVGPALFPGLIAVGLGICGVLLVVKGLVARRAADAEPWAALSEWTRVSRTVVAFFAVVAVNLFYVLLVDRLGFIPTGTIYLAVLFWAFGVPRGRIVPIALVVTLVIHYAFYKLLRVPLPWGVMQGMSW